MGRDEMTRLLDTGVWLGAVSRPRMVPAEVLALVQRPREFFGLAAISLWEIGKKVRRGKPPLPKDLAGWFVDAGVCDRQHDNLRRQSSSPRP
jgi:PIN domain nuclease of toxin-antitoxin system